MTMGVKRSRKIFWIQPCQEKIFQNHYVKQIAVETIKKNQKEEREREITKKSPKIYKNTP